MKLKIATPKPQTQTTELPGNVLADVYTIRQQYPKIGERIELLWGSAELQKYLNDLIFDGRGGREGFPRPIADAIMRLLKEHSKYVLEDHKNVWVQATY